MRGGMWTQIVCEGKSDRVHPRGPLFPRQLVSHSPTHWITQDALLDMIDAIDTDMRARPGDAELIPWLLVLDCAAQHVAKEFRNIMRDTRPHIKLCYVQRNFTDDDNQSVNQSNSKEGSFSCQCTMTFIGQNEEIKKIVLRMHSKLLSMFEEEMVRKPSPQTGWRMG